MNKILFLFLTLGLFGNIYCQNKVLVPELAGNYKGEIKKGLAHGFGEAEGVDYYKGEFKKGLPHGKGNYVWSDGQKYSGDWKNGIKEGYGALTFLFNDKDTTLKGYWYEDKFMGDKRRPDPDYKISTDIGVIRNNFIQYNKIDDKVIIKFEAEGSRDPFNVLLQSSSGDYKFLSLDKIIYEHVEFPFTLSISYRIENYFLSNYSDCRFKFIINKKGYWEVKLYN